MKGITQKQEKFCRSIAEGKNQTEAYVLAYSTKNMSRKSIWECASILAENLKVAARLKELRAPVAEKAQITLESHLNDLLRLRNLAVQKEQIAAAISAEIARGKAAGVHIEKSQLNLNLTNTTPMVNITIDILRGMDVKELKILQQIFINSISEIPE
ncbi:MAG: terminase [bacterium]|nr:terminase [bacterium]